MSFSPLITIEGTKPREYGNNKEIFKEVDGFIGYKVSNFGSIVGRKGNILKLQLGNWGYLQVQLYRYGMVKTRFVHNLVAEAFKGKCPKDKEVNHKDKNKLNNYINNLEYVTHTENCQHSVNAGNGIWNDSYKTLPRQKMKEQREQYFNALIQTSLHPQKRVITHGNAGKQQLAAQSRADKRGCDYCPLNKVHGVHKIFGKVKGRDIFIWAQSPGAKENKERKELVGPAGKFLWYELKRVGITRDQCDIQNVVRCWPVDIVEGQWPPFKMRTPSKQEIKCCSKYNEEALEKSKAKLHLVFGQIAAAAVLRKEFKKDQRIFYSDALQGWVVYLDHPAYFIRQGYTAGDGKPANASLKRFRDDLQKAKKLLEKKSLDRYGYLKEQNYVGVTGYEQSNIVYRKLKRKAKQGYRLIADMEEGKVNEKGEPDEKGESVALCCGFSYKPGTTYVFFLKHPDSGISKRCYIRNKRNVRRLLASSDVKLGFHFGISDTSAAKRLLRTTVKGYDYDTLLASYFKDPNAKAYGLTKVAERHYPEFLDYKSIEGPDAFTPEFKELLKTKKYAKISLPQQVALARTNNWMNLARLPWKKMVLYNGADCDLEKRIEIDTKKYVNQALMQVYIDSGYILHRMEKDS